MALKLNAFSEALLSALMLIVAGLALRQTARDSFLLSVLYSPLVKLLVQSHDA